MNLRNSFKAGTGNMPSSQMLVIALSIAPIFGLLVLGHLLRRGGIPSIEFWNLNDRLVYWVLMPSLLFYKTSTTDFDAALVGSYATVILGAFCCAVVVSIAVARAIGLSGAISSSVLQGSARHNTFIALAVAERLFGIDGLALAALASAMLIPVTNVTVVSLVVVLVSGRRQSTGVAMAIVRDLVRNPLLLAVALGVMTNFLSNGEIAVVHDMTRILGGAALPIMLLCVGASLRIQALTGAAVPIAVACISKMVVFPAAVVALALATGLTETQMMIAVLFGAVPTASSAYTLAKQLGGDAPLMAAIVTIQTGAAFFTLPITLMLVGMITG